MAPSPPDIRGAPGNPGRPSVTVYNFLISASILSGSGS